MSTFVVLIAARFIESAFDPGIRRYSGAINVLRVIAVISLTYYGVLALCILGNGYSRQRRALLQRAALASVAMFFGLKAGSYVHLCHAGSRWIEGAAFLGTPLVAGALVFLPRSRVVGALLAVILIAIVWLLQRPYLDWAHGN